MEKASSFLSSLFGSTAGALTDPSATVTSIFIYPIKSCRGISVTQACITSTGFRWDRQWMVVNDKGRARTQRVEPKLALVEIELPEGAFAKDWEPTEDSYMLIRAPEMSTLKVPLKKRWSVADDITVWEWSGNAFDEGDEASDWFSTFLGSPTRLIRFNTTSEVRDVIDGYAPGYRTLFTDGFPFTMASQGSLNLLNSRLKDPLPMNRFRPNILVDGCDPFSEDLWKVVTINKLTFNGVRLCARCKVPTINQDTGIAEDEPTETLRTFRSDNTLNLKKKQGKVYFANNFVCEESRRLSGLGQCIFVGDSVFVLQRFPTYSEAPI